jgi:hypothetical protein
MVLQTTPKQQWQKSPIGHLDAADRTLNVSHQILLFMPLLFDTNHFSVMTHNSNHDSHSSDDNAPSSELSACDEVLRETQAIHAEVFANGEIPEQYPAGHTRAFRLRFSLADFVTERGEDVVAATIGSAWLEFQELFEIVRDSLQQVTPGRRTVMGPM